MKVNALIYEADQCPINFLPQKIQRYYNALEQCKAIGYHQAKAVIYCRLYRLEPSARQQHAENAILADPNNGEVNLTF